MTPQASGHSDPVGLDHWLRVSRKDSGGAWGCVLFVSADAEQVGIPLDKTRHPPGKPSFPHPAGGRH